MSLRSVAYVVAGLVCVAIFWLLVTLAGQAVAPRGGSFQAAFTTWWGFIRRIDIILTAVATAICVVWVSGSRLIDRYIP